MSTALRRATQLILSRRLDPLDILTSTRYVVTRARYVSISLQRIETVAHVLSLRPLSVPEWDLHYHFFDGTERTLLYLLVLDAMNFSFWGEPKWTIHRVHRDLDGYWALAAALKYAFLRYPERFAANNLAELDPAFLARVLKGNIEIPLFVERWRNLVEVGRVLNEKFNGSAAHVVESAAGDAPTLARLIARHFSSFDDTSVYAGRRVAFYKRAQILVADIWGSFGGKGWGSLKNLDQLTAFADYKLPQLLRAWGILTYTPALARRIDRRLPIAKDSPEEIEIRAATLWGVELLRDALARLGRQLTSVEMDWFLWRASQGRVSGIKPHHRVRTIYY